QMLDQVTGHRAHHVTEFLAIVGARRKRRGAQGRQWLQAGLAHRALVTGVALTKPAVFLGETPEPEDALPAARQQPASQFVGTLLVVGLDAIKAREQRRIPADDDWHAAPGA